VFIGKRLIDAAEAVAETISKISHHMCTDTVWYCRMYRVDSTTRCRLSRVYRDESTESVLSLSKVVVWCDLVSLDALVVYH